VLTSHQILILYEGGLELEKVSSLDIRYLSYVIKSLAAASTNELMLCFNNKHKSTMHLILEEDMSIFFDLLKLRWVNYNPDKTLKVFGVNDSNLLQYHQNPKYNIVHVPPEECRLTEDEVISL